LGIPDVAPLCQGDIELMRLFLLHGFCQFPELALLNQCQLYLWVFWLSNICTGTGDTVDLHFWYNLQPVDSTWHWPWSGQPMSSDWLMWQWSSQLLFIWIDHEGWLSYLAYGLLQYWHRDGFLNHQQSICGQYLTLFGSSSVVHLNTHTPDSSMLREPNPRLQILGVYVRLPSSGLVNDGNLWVMDQLLMLLLGCLAALTAFPRHNLPKTGNWRCKWLVPGLNCNRILRRGRICSNQ